MVVNGDAAAVRRQMLNELVAQVGAELVAETLRLELEAVGQLLEGTAEISPEIGAGIDEFAGLLAGAVGVAPRGAAPAPAAVNGNDAAPIVTVDLDGDGVADLELAGVAVGPAARGWAESEEQRRVSLRAARAMALSVQFRVGMEHRELVAALELCTRIELVLIMYFGETVPDPGMEWDGERRLREVEKRMARLRWVTREHTREFSGLKGMWKRMIGKGPVSGRDLYEQMTQEADVMLDMMELSEERTDGLESLMRRSGLERLL